MNGEEKKAMRACIKWLENESGADICGHCTYYNADDYDYDSEDIECPHRKAKGSDACVDGMIEHFKREVKA